mmetsp:Transcript_8712/g.14814  ORF Transcript_8712/g.14814 Transcript_8712/m.14814 type:complete len:985 (-) Transcript_8712:5078-8032(-)
MTAHLREVLLTELHDTHLHVHTHVHHTTLDFCVEIDLCEEEVRHTAQRLLGPFSEPIDRAAVHQGREHAQTRAEGLTNGGQTQHQVQVRADTAHKEVVHFRGNAGVDAGLLAGLGQTLHHCTHLLIVEQVGDLASIENAVDILEEGLTDDLGVVDHEHCGLVQHTSFVHHALDVLTPLVHAVTLGDFNREQLKVSNAHRQGGEGLATGATDTHQQSIAVSLVNNAGDAGNVLHGALEQHQVHRLGGHLVVVIEIVVHHLRQGGAVHQLHIGLAEGFGVTKGAVQCVGVVAADLSVVNVEELLHGRANERLEPHAIGIVDETIVEDTHALVGPQPHKRVLLLDEVLVTHEHALEYLGQVTQIERVVTLGRRGQQRAGDVVVDRDRSQHGGLRKLLDRCSEALGQAPVDDGAEDTSKGLVAEVHEVDHIEVSHIALRDARAASTGGTHCGAELNVHQAAELVFFAVIPALVVHPLAQNLNGRLGTIFFLGGHIEIIHEHDSGHAQWRANHTLAALVQLGVDEILGLVGAGLGGEVQRDRVEVGRHATQELVANGHRLTRAGVSRADHMETLAQELLQKPFVTNGVDGGHHDGVEGGLLGDLESGLIGQPVVPLGRLRVEEVVIHDALVRHRLDGRAVRSLNIGGVLDLEVLVLIALVAGTVEQRAKEHIELLATFTVHAGADGPDHGIDVATLDGLGHIRCYTIVKVKQTLEQTSQREDELLRRHRGRHAAIFAHEVTHHGKGPVKEPRQVLNVVGQTDRQAAQPDVTYRGPANVAGLTEDHADTGHGGRGGLLQVLGFEEHRHGVAHLDDLTRGEAELLVVVEHRVHVFNPHRIDRSVKHHPLAVGRRVLGALAEGHGQDSLHKLVRVLVEETIQLLGSDRFGVNRVDLHLGEVWGSIHTGLGHGLGEIVNGCGLARAGLTHHHDSVTHHDHLVQLDCLALVLRLVLEDVGVVRGDFHAVVAGVLQTVNQHAVVSLWQLHPRKQI